MPQYVIQCDQLVALSAENKSSISPGTEIRPLSRMTALQAYHTLTHKQQHSTYTVFNIESQAGFAAISSIQLA